MIDHVLIGVDDIAVARAFYEHALAPLGVGLLMDRGDVVGFGRDGKPAFWLRHRSGVRDPVHVAFAVEDRPTVDAFHAAGLAAGGTDNGGPGIRAIYHPSYYGAFVLDPDGHNIEAVCHRPPPGEA
jgi:catechol 2,3-dioxygenase-like lactoylglutathione lyase family enzyme